MYRPKLTSKLMFPNSHPLSGRRQKQYLVQAVALAVRASGSEVASHKFLRLNLAVADERILL